MADFLFVSQEMLDNWMMQEKIDFSGNEMVIRGDSRRYVLEPAVRFVQVAGTGGDPAGLIGKVKTLDQVAEAGGEHYADSVILDDTAYDIQNGFLAKVRLPAGEAPPKAAVAEGAEPPAAAPPAAVPPELPAASPAAPPAPEAGAEAEPPSDEDEEALLARFLLDNLR
jgi:hypothetical protein